MLIHNLLDTGADFTQTRPVLPSPKEEMNHYTDLFPLKAYLSTDLRGLFTSIMESSSKGLLTQVTQFWNLLDDLAESNPEGYEKFIQQQLKEGEQLCAAPEPWLCLQTRILVCTVGSQGWEVLTEIILE